MTDLPLQLVMSTATLAYPPPLSAPPTVETLERLLAGLQRPVERGVPTPPPVVAVPERLFEDVRRPAPVVLRPASGPALTWSAGNAHPTLPFPFGFLTPLAGAATAVAVAALTMLGARDVALP